MDADIITDRQIMTLRREALDHGDTRMAVICELAIDGEYGWAEPGTDMDDLREEGRTQQWAREQCAQAIAETASCAIESLTVDWGGAG